MGAIERVKYRGSKPVHPQGWTKLRAGVEVGSLARGERESQREILVFRYRLANSPSQRKILKRNLVCAKWTSVRCHRLQMSGVHPRMQSYLAPQRRRPRGTPNTMAKVSLSGCAAHFHEVREVAGLDSKGRTARHIVWPSGVSPSDEASEGLFLSKPQMHGRKLHACGWGSYRSGSSRREARHPPTS